VFSGQTPLSMMELEARRHPFIGGTTMYAVTLWLDPDELFSSLPSFLFLLLAKV
jgi:hypothetical protein